MVRIRFRRVGAKHQASYRIVAADRESPRDGRFLEVLGFYNPRTEPATVQVDERRLFHWMKNGALPSDAVHTTLRAGGTWERWERYKQGEELDALLVEAETAWKAPDSRTRRDDLAGSRRRKRRRMAAEEAPKAAEAGPGAPAAAPAAPAAAGPEAAEPEASQVAGPEAASVEAPEAESAASEAAVEAEPAAAEAQPEASDEPAAAEAQPEASGEPADAEPEQEADA